MPGHLSWLEAIVIGLLQGVAELFPVSSLGHSILLPAVVGGRWARDLDVSAAGSPYLAFVVGLHVATALAMIVYFWRDWARVVAGLASSITRREVVDADQRLAWRLIIASIPVGLAGLALDHVFRTLLARPIPTAVFLVLNGLVLLAVEEATRRRAAAAVVAGTAPTEAVPAVTAPRPPRAGAGRRPGRVRSDAVDAPTTRFSVPVDADTDVLPVPGKRSVPAAPEVAADARLAGLPLLRAVLIGASQILALLPGVSRSGVTIGAGLTARLDHADAARFAFLLATPVILAAGVLKLPDLLGPAGDGIRPQVLVGSLLSGVGAYVSVRFLTGYFENRSLRPFGVYCVVAGAACLTWFSMT